MVNGKTISVGEILWNVLRQPVATELSLEQASEFALEVLRLIGAPLSFLDKTEELQINNYKVALPDNLIDIRGIRCDGRPMRYATDLYHMSLDESTHNYQQEYTYVVQNCVLTTSIKKGCVEISYRAINTDENGYPLIPDNQSYKMAIEYHILWRYLEPLWTMGKIQDKVFSYYSQQRDWYIGQASTSMMIANGDHLQSIMNGINKLIIDTQAYDRFYKNYGSPQHIKRY